MSELDDIQEDPAPSPGRRRAGAGGFAAGLLFGVILGAGVALLLAPDRGSRTRRALQRGLRRFRDEAGEGLERAGSRTRRELKRRRRELEDRLEQARERFD
jgi:gas vesicle protein